MLLPTLKFKFSARRHPLLPSPSARPSSPVSPSQVDPSQSLSTHSFLFIRPGHCHFTLAVRLSNPVYQKQLQILDLFHASIEYAEPEWLWHRDHYQFSSPVSAVESVLISSQPGQLLQSWLEDLSVLNFPFFRLLSGEGFSDSLHLRKKACSDAIFRTGMALSPRHRDLDDGLCLTGTSSSA
jgi:hypothetical protein